MILFAGLVVAAAVLAAGARSRSRAHVPAPAHAAVVESTLPAAGLAAALLVAGVPPQVAVAGAVTGGVATVGRRRRRRRRLVRAGGRETVVFVHALAGELRAGRPVGAALSAAASQLPVLGPSVSAVAQAAQLGGDVPVELRVAASQPGCARLGTVAAAWEASSATGARMADVLDGVGAAFDADDQVGAELDALLAGPRATVVVLALLPLGALALGSGIGAHPLQVLLHTPVGSAALAGAAVLDGLGLIWLRTVAARAVAAT